MFEFYLQPRVRQASVGALAAVSGLNGEDLMSLTRQLEAIAGTDGTESDTGILVDDYQVVLLLNRIFVCACVEPSDGWNMLKFCILAQTVVISAIP